MERALSDAARNRAQLTSRAEKGDRVRPVGVEIAFPAISSGHARNMCPRTGEVYGLKKSECRQANVRVSVLHVDAPIVCAEGGNSGRRPAEREFAL